SSHSLSWFSASTVSMLASPPVASTAPASSPSYTLSLHDALPIFTARRTRGGSRPHSVLGTAKRRMQTLGTQESSSMSCSGTRRRSEEHTSELQSRFDLVCRLLLEKKKKKDNKLRVGGQRQGDKSA